MAVGAGLGVGVGVGAGLGMGVGVGAGLGMVGWLVGDVRRPFLSSVLLCVPTVTPGDPPTPSKFRDSSHTFNLDCSLTKILLNYQKPSGTVALRPKPIICTLFGPLGTPQPPPNSETPRTLSIWTAA